MKKLVNSCTTLDRIRMRVSRKSCVARPWEERRHAVSKFRRAISMKITVENNKRCNIAVECKEFKTVSKRRRINKTKSI